MAPVKPKEVTKPQHERIQTAEGWRRSQLKKKQKPSTTAGSKKKKEA